ncbi:hypothetical protein ACP70R_023851 [Stipagrostis hirtigluma subsp. patula]
MAMKGVKPGEIELIQAEGLASPAVASKPAVEINKGEVATKVHEDVGSPPQPLAPPEKNKIEPHAQGGGLENAVASGAAKGACIACFEWLLEELTSCCCDN